MKTMKAIIKNLFLSLLIFPLWAIEGAAQVVGTPYAPPYMPNVCMGSTTKGTDFWVSFGRVAGGDIGTLALNIATDATTRVELTFTGDVPSKTTFPAQAAIPAQSMAVYNIAANRVQRIRLDSIKNTNTETDINATIFNDAAKDMREGVYLSTLSPSGTTSNKTLHIHTNKPVSVYAFNVYSAITDATILLPQTAWGTDYYRLAYRPFYATGTSYDYEMIIANENGTEIKLGATTLATLSKGQVYYNSAATTDRTGRHITTSKPVAYFTHNTIIDIPSNQDNGDILFEQLPPVTQWGKQFLVPNAFENTEINPPSTTASSNVGTNIIRVVASVAGTKVTWSGATTFMTDGGKNISSGGTLNEGEWVALRIDGTVDNNPSCYISADEPVGVAAFMTGATFGRNAGASGDPSIAWIPALNQSVQSALIAPFMFPYNIGGNTHLGETNSIHYMIIIAPTGKEILTTVNGSSNGSNNPFYYQNQGGGGLSIDITNSPLPAAAKMNGGALNNSGSWKTNTDAGYSYYVWRFTNPTATANNDFSRMFKIVNPYGIIVLVGGVAHNETYYYNAGSGTCGVNP
jgi:hypothetical protein